VGDGGGGDDDPVGDGMDEALEGPVPSRGGLGGLDGLYVADVGEDERGSGGDGVGVDEEAEKGVEFVGANERGEAREDG